MEKNIILTIDDKSYKVVPDGDEIANCREHCALYNFCDCYSCKAKCLVDNDGYYHFVELKIEK